MHPPWQGQQGGTSTRPQLLQVLRCDADQGDKSTGQVTRADVAAVCVAALTDPAAENLTLEIMSKPPAAGVLLPPLTEQLKGFFHGLQRDS